MTAINKYLKHFEAYQNGDLSTGEAQKFIQSLEQNREMRIAWREYLDMMDALSDKEAVTLRSRLEGAFSKHQDGKIRFLSQAIWLRASAAAIILFVMGTLLYFFCSSNDGYLENPNKPQFTNSDIIIHDSVDKGVPEDTMIIPTSEERGENVEKVQQLASIYDQERYQISPVFAELLHNVYRSSWFKIVTPEDSVIYISNDSIVFSWETNIEESILFDVLDRNGRVVYKHDTPISSPWTFRPELDPAIYMYRFATKDQPVWLGVMVGR